MSKLRRVPACLVASVTMVVCSLAVAAPPEEPVPTPDPAVTEPTATETTVTETTATEPAPLEPAPVEPPPREPAPVDAPLPAWSDEIPSYDQASIPQPSPSGPPLVPPDGNGSMTVGAMLLGGGLILTASSVVLLFEDSDEVGVWITGATLGSLVIPAGLALLITGAVKHRRYEPFRLAHDPPPSGTGMFAGGTLAMSAGGFGMLMGGVSLALQDADDLPYGEVLLSLGAASLVTGIALVTVGAKRGKRFDAWHKAQVVPTFGVLAHPQTRTAGATFGIAGRLPL